MKWGKYSVEDRKIPGISIFAFVLIIIGLYAESKLVIFAAIFFQIIVIVNDLYLKQAGTGLLFTNKMQKFHHFINETGKWILIFQNVGYPILKAELRVYFDECVGPIDDKVESHNSMFEIIIPFSILPHQTKQLIIPYKAIKRGVAKIRKLELHIPSLIGFGAVVLEFRDLIKLEAIVYPTPIPVKGLKEQVSILQGGNAVPFSVYEDRIGPLGTRDYVPADSFKQIHWKASARKLNLQTKVYEKISEKGWNISINLAEGYAITGQLEPILSSVTEFSYYAVKHQIPYSICINVRTAGNTPFYYIPKGEGKEHLQKVLEALASINRYNTIFPYEKMLSFYIRHLAEQPFFLHAGGRSAEIDSNLLQIRGKGVYLSGLMVTEEHGILSRLEIHQERRRIVK